MRQICFLRMQCMRKSVTTPSDGAQVKHNLEMVLETEFIAKTSAEAVDFTMECGICYAYDLDGAIPEKVCEDRRCARSFHESCLFEYIRGLPGVRQSFGTYFGECPYCSTAITVKMT
eukprot:m.194373 g.194373  ORF g.194373 m.194373 type:complete len:117 (+) comp18647_c0_seq6:213-563(+)